MLARSLHSPRARKAQSLMGMGTGKVIARVLHAPLFLSPTVAGDNGAVPIACLRTETTMAALLDRMPEELQSAGLQHTEHEGT